MRIIDFKELLTLPPHTFFSIVVCRAARHAAVVTEVYSKLPSGSEGMSFHGDKVNLLEGYEFPLADVARAYVRNESLSVPRTARGQEEFLYTDYVNVQFATWEKQDIEELVEKFKRALSVFSNPPVVTN